MRKMLIVVDMLNDFCHKDGTLATSHITGELYAERAIPVVKAKIEEYRENGDSIIWLCDSHDPEDKEFKRFPKHAVRASWGSEIIKELEPSYKRYKISEHVIYKTRYSGFYNTRLDDILTYTRSDDEVEVVGVCTSICVMDTVGGCANRDYNVSVVKDGVADFDPEAHESALKRMEGLYGAKII